MSVSEQGLRVKSFCVGISLLVSTGIYVLCTTGAVKAAEPTNNTRSQHPVIAKVRQQLGVKTAFVTKPAATPVEQNLSQTTKDNPSPITMPKPNNNGDTPPAEKATTPTRKDTKATIQPNPPRNEAQSLAAFYAQPGRQPIWVSGTKAQEKTRKIIHEFNHADAYGLRPHDFGFMQESSLALIGKKANPTPAQLAELEISLSKAVLKYARYAKGGRIDPRRLSRFQDRGPITPDFTKLLNSISNTDKPDELLRSLHPQHPQFKALRKKLASLLARTTTNSEKEKDKKPKAKFPPTGPSLKLGMAHSHVALLRTRLGLKEIVNRDEATKFDDIVLKSLKKFQKKNGLGTDGVVGPQTRQVLAGIPIKKISTEKLRARLLINMERWRWMPENMQGNNNIFVWANVPELRVRIIKEGKLIFAERVIAGLPNKQSPMFSDKMEWIEFNPTWYIPNSIKVADILPSLRGKGRVMKKYHLRIDCGKFGTDFSTIDWKKVDIRKCAVIQPTGARSVLGKLKFKFPNKHAVYMHDTLTPGLFNRKHRILSHGCIRIRNPRRMAEVLLANDKGMSAKRVGSLLARGGLHTERLKRSIPVHITYFSTRAKDDGSLSHHPDYYGHDKRLARALLGKGHLFRGAIYSGRKKYKRKPRPKPASGPTIQFPGQ